MIPTANYHEPNILAQDIITNRGIEKITKSSPIYIWVHDLGDLYSLHDAIDIFPFKPVDQIKKSFLESGLYSQESIKEMISGLYRLPGYANKTTNKSRGSTKSRS